MRDRTAWEVAVAEGDILDGSGPAARWKPATRATNVRSYGRYLAFVDRMVGLKEGEGPADRCTREMVGSYIGQLQATTASKSVASSITGLLVMMEAMEPDRDWTWLKTFAYRLQRNAKPSRDKRSRLMPAHEILLAALDRLTELSVQGFTKRAQFVEFRNVLMIAMLTDCPIRRKNMAALTLDGQLVRQPDRWAIHIPGAEVKNGVPIDLEYLDSLTHYIDLYVNTVRPLLSRYRNDGSLWLTAYGKTMSGHALYLRIVPATEQLLGRPLSPHLFRDIAVTTVVTESPSATLATRGLLGHTDFRTTEKHYIQAQQINAGRIINNLLEGIRAVKPAR